MGNYESQGEFDYLAGVEVESQDEIPEGMTSWEIPIQIYAVFTFQLKLFGEEYRYVYQEWLPKSGYELGDGLGFEYYPEDFNFSNEDAELSFHIPIH